MTTEELQAEVDRLRDKVGTLIAAIEAVLRDHHTLPVSRAKLLAALKEIE